MLRVQLKRFIQKMSVRYVGDFFPSVLQVSSLIFLWWHIVDGHDIIDRVSPRDKLKTNPVQELWNIFSRTHISIFINHKQELDSLWSVNVMIRICDQG